MARFPGASNPYDLVSRTGSEHGSTPASFFHFATFQILFNETSTASTIASRGKSFLSTKVEPIKL